MEDGNEQAPAKVKIQDKRRVTSSEDDQVAEIVDEPPVEEHDYLDELMRLRADFDNYRKRVMREQTSMAQRGAIDVIEKLLTVLDNFEKAIAHGEGGEGVALVHKQLIEALAQSGLEEIYAAGEPFDPSVHEAVDTHEDPDVTEQVVRDVYRPGYRVGDRLLRPAMVSVARPAEESPQEETG